MRSRQTAATLATTPPTVATVVRMVMVRVRRGVATVVRTMAVLTLLAVVQWRWWLLLVLLYWWCWLLWWCLRGIGLITYDFLLIATVYVFVCGIARLMLLLVVHLLLLMVHLLRLVRLLSATRGTNTGRVRRRGAPQSRPAARADRWRLTRVMGRRGSAPALVCTSAAF